MLGCRGGYRRIHQRSFATGGFGGVTGASWCNGGGYADGGQMEKSGDAGALRESGTGGAGRGGPVQVWQIIKRRRGTMFGKVKLFLFLWLVCFGAVLGIGIIGCGGDEALEEDTSSLADRLYEELVGEYELIRWIVKYADGGETREFKPPEVTGFMTITLNRTLKQEIEIRDKPGVAEGTFEIFPDKGVMEVRQGVVTIPLIYTWDGSIFTTTRDSGVYFETDYWRKL